MNKKIIKIIQNPLLANDVEEPKLESYNLKPVIFYSAYIRI